MTDLRNSDVGVGFLERLLALSERNPDRSRAASAAPNYDDFETADQIARFQDRMAAAERFGAVEIQRGRRERSHLIDRVRVKDAALLARHLGRPTAIIAAERAKVELLPIASTGEAWVVKLLDDMAARWSRGETAYRLAPAPLDLAREFFTLLASISRHEAQGLDARTFSLKATTDTKAFDRHASRLATVLGIQMGEPGASVEKVWSYIGLERFSHPIHLKGCLRIEGDHGVLVEGMATPFASIHPEMLPRLRTIGRPAAVLTIENYASFNRQVREIDDDSLIVYVGGFPSAAVVALLAKVLSAIPHDVPFLHWGDVDSGGLRIFRYLEENLPRGPQPHLMSKELAEAFGKPAAPDPSLASIARSESAVSGLADWLAFGAEIRHLEQEALEPRSPLPQVGTGG